MEFRGGIEPPHFKILLPFTEELKFFVNRN